MEKNWIEPEFIEREFYTNKNGDIMQYAHSGCGAIIYLYACYYLLDKYGTHICCTTDDSFWRKATLEEKQLLIDKVEEKTGKKFNFEINFLNNFED